MLRSLGSLQYTCKSNFVKVLIKAMYLLAFHAFLRVGEITGRLPPQENCMTANNLNFICDDCNNPHSIKIKLDQYKHSSTSNIPTLLIQTNTNIEFCPENIRKRTK
jgi:hypothetical protein